MSEVRDILREVRLTIGDEGDSGDRERQQARVKRMLLAMGVAEDDLDNELREHKREQEVGASLNVSVWFKSVSYFHICAMMSEVLIILLGYAQTRTLHLHCSCGIYHVYMHDCVT